MLADRVAIVTGGGNGIGRAYCLGLAAEGADIVVAELNEQAAEETAEAVRQLGRRALAVKTDVADEQSVAAMVEAAIAELGRIDILINNAAVFSSVPMTRSGIEDLSVDEWDLMMAVNLRGTFLASRAVLSAMRAQGYGKIINISSGRALSGSPNSIHYVTTKAGILGFTRTLAREVGKDGIRVNTLAPGNTLSEADPSEATIELRQKRVGSRAIQRVQRPDDLVGAAIFLASEASDFVTGQTLVVDGGGTMH